MITSSVVKQIQRLLAEGLYSQREIGRMTRVSRGTVGAIARGKRRDYDTWPRGREPGPEGSAGPPRRCPGCGGLVYMPCHLCHVRKLAAESRVAPLPRRAEEPLRLELSERHRARYQEVRRRRMQQRRLRRRK